MSLIAAVRTGASTDVLTSLRAVCDSQGLRELSARLLDLTDLVKWDMREVESALSTLPAGPTAVHKSALHLLGQGGKRLRPMCVALAAHLGTGFGPKARDLGVAVELVHCATLLHDDVVDLGDARRGAPAARTVYGNAASIFAGDWLLVEALRRVGSTGVDGVLVRLLDIIEEMIFAESIQLENRGRIDLPVARYFQVVEGKTAALFRWAMFAGGRAGGLPERVCDDLETYGRHLGVAFQLIDDVLDYAGDEAVTGKALFADLREGKMTYPLIVALEREPAFADVLEEVVALAPGQSPTAAQRRELVRVLHQTDALAAGRRLAVEQASLATAALAALDDSRARTALLTVAQAPVHRDA